MLRTSSIDVNSKNVLIVFFLQPTKMELPSSGFHREDGTFGMFKRIPLF